MEIANNFRGRGGRRLADLQVDPDHLEALRRIDLEVILRDGLATGEFVGISADSMALAVRSAIGGAVMRATADPDFDVVAYGEDLVTAFARATEPGSQNGWHLADILIAAYGSRGDIMPLTGIAGALQRVGHRVSMTCTPDLVDEITPLGIDARPVDFRLDASIRQPPIR